MFIGIKVLKPVSRKLISYSTNNLAYETNVISKFPVPQGSFWTKKKNQIKFFDWLGVTLGYTQFEDWYNLNAEQVVRHGGKRLLYYYYNGSVVEALLSIYPQYQWKMWNFKQVPYNYWQNVDNHRLFFDDLGKSLGIKVQEDWYKITQKSIVNHGGKYLLARYYNGSPVQAITTVYSHLEWNVFMFQNVPKDYWKNKHNHKLFFDALGRKFNYSKPEDWYNISINDVAGFGGSTLLEKYYHWSPVKAVMSIYPHFNWKIWYFNRVPAYDAMDAPHVKQFLNELGSSLKVLSLDGWYRVSSADLLNVGVWHFIESRGGLVNLLTQAYPEYAWDSEKFCIRQKKSNQWWLLNTLREIFSSNTVILEEYLHPHIKTKEGNQLRLDIFLPDLNLAFEYQGIHHYSDHALFGPLSSHKKRDNEKRQACVIEEITLIEIPYWWKRDKESIIAALKQCRPELVKHL
eukprot:TRINITY_DN11551_c0_g1_i1.p1 TRINITY_DN11551_c0_g1~~TRINITY_DN11551_c0_g1_i1.p1  ORF type:complete len:459 (+),score=59.77 TRINITY_DN11551_c0_g1_i1:87-1463(+)